LLSGPKVSWTNGVFFFLALAFGVNTGPQIFAGRSFWAIFSFFRAFVMGLFAPLIFSVPFVF